MRVAELSLRAGVPIPTIKYYLRAGLLPPGVRTSPNQARYGDDHVRRLRLIRMLTEVGGLSIAAVKQELATVPISAGAPDSVPTADAWQAARDRVGNLLAAHGWATDLSTPPGNTLVAAVAALNELGRPDLVQMLERYAAIAAELAAIDATLATDAEAQAINPVIGDVIQTALRRLARPPTGNLLACPTPRETGTT